MNPAKLYETLILWIGDGTGASDTVLHIHAGMAILMTARLVTGRSLATPIPLALVFAAEICNETMDRIAHGSWQWSDTMLDLLNTVFWPTVLYVGLRMRRPRIADLQAIPASRPAAESDVV